MADTLRAYSAFVTTYAAAFAASEAPAHLADDLDALANELLEANERQEQAIQRTEDAGTELCKARGEVYNLCAKVYRAGRTAFRKDDTVATLFKFAYMKRVSSSSSASDSGVTGAEGTTASAAPGVTVSSDPSVDDNAA